MNDWEKVAIILARGNSQRIKNKNIIKFQNKPMIYWPIKCAKETGIFNQIIVSTDSKKIKKIVENQNISVPFLRSKINSRAKSLPIDVIKEVINKLDIKKKIYICCFFANTPFAYTKDVINGLKILKKKNISTVLPVKRVDSRYQRILVRKKSNYISYFNQQNIYKRSQDLSDSFIDAGQWFWIKFNPNNKKKNNLSGNIGYVELPEYRVCDIDNYKDLKRAKILVKKNKFYGQKKKDW